MHCSLHISLGCFVFFGDCYSTNNNNIKCVRGMHENFSGKKNEKHNETNKIKNDMKQSTVTQLVEIFVK